MSNGALKPIHIKDLVKNNSVVVDMGDGEYKIKNPKIGEYFEIGEDKFTVVENNGYGCVQCKFGPQAGCIDAGLYVDCSAKKRADGQNVAIRDVVEVLPEEGYTLIAEHLVQAEKLEKELDSRKVSLLKDFEKFISIQEKLKATITAFKIDVNSPTAAAELKAYLDAELGMADASKYALFSRIITGSQSIQLATDLNTVVKQKALADAAKQTAKEEYIESIKNPQ